MKKEIIKDEGERVNKEDGYETESTQPVISVMLAVLDAPAAIVLYKKALVLLSYGTLGQLPV